MRMAAVRNNASKAAIGVIVDPEIGESRARRGSGRDHQARAWRQSGISGDAPFEETFVVEQLSDGRFHRPGPYFGAAK